MSDDQGRDQVTKPSSSSSLEDKKLDDDQQSYWQTLVESVYANGGASLNSTQFLIDSLDKLSSSRQEVLEHVADLEPFYTSLVCILTSKLVEQVPSCTIDQVRGLESGSQVLLDYLLQYIRQRLVNEDEYALVSSLQALSLIEGMLSVGGGGGNKPSNRTSTTTTKPVIDLDTLITILNSAQVPAYHPSSSSTSNSNNSSQPINNNVNNELVAVKSNEKSMESLISSFLSNSKPHVKSEASNSSSSKIEIVDEKTSSSTTAVESPVELFQQQMCRHLAASCHGGLKTILDLLASSLTYLNVYRKNHLKQLRSITTTSSDSSSTEQQLNSLAQLGCLTYDQAVQTRANCSSLLNDLTQLYSLLLLPIFKSKTQWDREDMDQLEELVQSSQIALLVTNYAQYVVATKSTPEQRLQHQSSTSSNKSYQEDVAEINELTSTSNMILTKYLEVVERGCAENNVSQVQSRLAYTISFFLYKQLDEYNSEMAKWIDQTSSSLTSCQQNLLNHISYLKPVSAKINSLLTGTFQSATSGDEIKQKLDSFKYPDGNNLFSILFSLFRTFFLKLNILLVNNNNNPETNKVATLATMTKQVSRVSKQQSVVSSAEIKNIDDDDDDEDDGDESDDCLLIGSWFEEESEETKKESTTTTATNTTNTGGKTSSSEIMLSLSSSSSKNQASLEIITLPSVLIYLMERIVDLARLTGDADGPTNAPLDYLRQSVRCSDLAFYIKQMSKECKFPASFTTPFYKFIRFLLVDNVLTASQMDQLTESLNVVTTPTSSRVNTQVLAIVTQIYVIKLVKQSEESRDRARSDIVKMWDNTLDLLTHCRPDSTSSVEEDLSPEYAAVLLFLFHHLTGEQRAGILLKSVRLVIDNKTTTSSLYTSRLTTLLHYLIAHFDQPSDLLLQTMSNSGILGGDTVESAVAANLDIPFLNKLRSIGQDSTNHRPHYSFVTSDLFVQPIKASFSAIDILLKGDDYDKFYTSLINLAWSDHDDDNKSDINVKEDRLSRSLNLLTIWSLVETLPVSFKWLSSVMDMVFSFDSKTNQVVDLNRDSLATSSQSNPHILHLFRVIYSSNVVKSLDENKHIVDKLTSVIDLVRGGGGVSHSPHDTATLAKQFKFFVDFWTVKLNIKEDEAAVAIRDELLDANLDLLLYHLAQIHACLGKSAAGEFKSTRSFTAYFQLIVRLAREYKTFYKQQLLDVYFAQIKNDELTTDIVSLVLNISSSTGVGGSTNHQINSLLDTTTKSNQQTSCNYLVNLNNETTSDESSSSSSSVVSFFRPVLNFFHTSRSTDSNYDDVVNSNSLETSLLKSMVARETARIDICILVLLERALAQFNTGICLVVSDESLLSQVEDLFIEFNCDLNTLSTRIASEQIVPFFNSIMTTGDANKSTTSTTQRTRGYIVGKVCRFALNTIHKIIVKQSEFKDQKQQLRATLSSFLFSHVNRSIDTQIGVSSLIKLYEPSSPSDKSLLVDLLSSYMNTLDHVEGAVSPQSCLLVFINKLLKHNMNGMILEPIVNQIYSFLQLKDSFSNLIVKYLKSSSQTEDDDRHEDLSVLRFKFELKQLALLLNQNTSNPAASSTASYLLNVLIDVINNNDKEQLDLAELIQLMDGFASASEQGHLVLLKASCAWLNRFNESIQSEVAKKTKPGKIDQRLLKTVSYILAYISDLLSNSGSHSTASSQLAADLNDLESTKTLSKLFASQLAIDFDAHTLELFNTLQKQLRATASDEAKKDNAATTTTTHSPVGKEKRNSLTIARIKRKRRKTKDDKETVDEQYDNELNGTFDEEDEAAAAGDDQDWQNEDDDNEFYDEEDDEDDNEDEEEDEEAGNNNNANLNASSSSTQQFNLNEIFEENEFNEDDDNYEDEEDEEVDEEDEEQEEEDEEDDDDGSWYNGGQNSFDETYNDQDEFSGGSDQDSSSQQQQQTATRRVNKNRIQRQIENDDDEDDETENQEEDEDEDDDDDDDGNDYPEDDEDFVEVENGQSGQSGGAASTTSNGGINLNNYQDIDDNNTSSSRSQSSLTIQQLPSNNNDNGAGNVATINDLLYVVEDEDDDEEDEEATNYVIATGGNGASGQELIAENEDDEEGDEEEDEDEEEEDDDDYGDEFNDNLNDYEHVHPVSTTTTSTGGGGVNTLIGPSTFRLVQPSQISAVSGAGAANNTTSSAAASNRDLIYQDIISQITTATTAFNNNNPSNNNNMTSYILRAPLQQPAAMSRPNLTSGPSGSSSHVADLDSRLCTYTVTKKDFMNQHWYYCHTCMMVERTGVCSVCARVCHRGHDLSYAKYGSFFCDCGAKEDGSCKALTKRDKAANESVDNKKDSKSRQQVGKQQQHQQAKKRRTSHNHPSGGAGGVTGAGSLFSANTELNTLEWIKKLQNQARQNKLSHLRRTVIPPGDQEEITTSNSSLQVVKAANESKLYRLVRSMMTDLLLPLARSTYADSLLPTSSLLARRQLARLNGEARPNDGIFKHDDYDEDESSLPLQIETQQLFVVTLGSQEGAFEHVRATYSGDDGATLKQLVQSHQIRRSSMCCMSSGGVKQHLIVTHEKNKSSHFTILQLNALLKQDSQRRSKLTLTKLNTVSVPFTLVGCVANASNPNYVALTGLKDCMVMYLNEQGQTSRQQEMAESAAAANAAAATTTTTTNPAPATTTTAAATKTTSTDPKSTTTTSKSTNLSSSNSSSGLLVLQPALEGSNYIVKSIWLPGSRSELAIVTADFVKIYDLSVDKLAPVYYFLLPMGKIRDVTFVYDLVRVVDDGDEKPDTDSNKQPSAGGLRLSKYKQVKYIVIMSSCGLMYYEAMNEVTSARHGVYYVTNTIDMITPLSTESSTGKDDTSSSSSQCESSSVTTTAAATTNGSSSSQYGSGVSVYYSFKLKLLFWSYQQGKSFMGSFKSHSLELRQVYALVPKPAANQQQQTQALCNWSEISNHPGLVMCMTLTSNNPVIMMFLPSRVYYQEIKLTNNQGGPTKVKIQDMVAIRHVSSTTNKLNDSKTTMIILCDDGSLKIYVADSSKTEHWLQPQFKQTSPMSQHQQIVKSSSSSNRVWPAWNLFSMLPSTVQEMHEKRVKIQLRQQASRKQSTGGGVDPPATVAATSETTSAAVAGAATPATPAIQSKPPPAAPTRLLRRANAIKRRPTVNSSGKSRTSSSQQARTTTNNNSNHPAQQQQQQHQQLFDIDYLEKCAQINDFDIGGNDILEIYNSHHIKSRLQLSNSKSVLMNSPDGFSFEISFNQTNPSYGSMLLVGCRIHVGNKAASLESVPQYFEVCNRRINVSRLQRGRWIDICLTREEAIVADNKIVIRVGPSQDTRTHCSCLDGLIVYAKSRDEMSWSQAEFDKLKSEAQRASVAAGGVRSSGKLSSEDKKKKTKKMEKKLFHQPVAQQSSESWVASYEPKLFDRVLSQSLEIAEQCLVLTGAEKATSTEDGHDKDTPHTISSQLLALICPPLVSQRARSLLFSSLAYSSTQFNVRDQERASVLRSIVPLYQSYKDEATLQLVSATFNSAPAVDNQDYLDQLYDWEQLQRVLLVCKSLISELRANNLVTFLGHSFKSSTGFIVYLNSLFWRCVDRHYSTTNTTSSNNNDTDSSYSSSTSSIGQCELSNLNACIESLVECMHSFLIVEAANKQATSSLNSNNDETTLIDSLLSSPLVTLIFECYLKLVGSSNLDINFISRRTILNLLKFQPILIPSNVSNVKKSPSMQTSSSLSSKSKTKQPTTSSKEGGDSGGADVSSSSSSVDEKVQLFPGQATAASLVDNEQLEMLDENQQATGSVGDVSSEEQQVSTTAGAGASATTAAQFISLAPFNLNDEEEMLQFAMALSLNEANNASNVAGNTQPPPILPRQSLSNVAASKPSKSSSSSKNETTTSSNKKEAENNEVSSTTDINVHQLVPQQPPAYLVNINPRLVSLRKVFLTKLADRIDADFLIQTFCRVSVASSQQQQQRLSDCTPTTPPGLKCVAFFQCILNLMSDLNPKEPGDKHLLDTILQGLLGVLQPLKTLSLELKKPSNVVDSSRVASTDTDPIYTRSPSNEIRLLCLRTISILLSKSKYQRTDGGANTTTSGSSSGNNCNFVIQTLLSHLCHFGLIDMCMHLLRYVLNEYWRKVMPTPTGDQFIESADQSSTNLAQPKTANLIKFSDESRFYDELAPFFVADPLNKDSFVIPPPNLMAAATVSSSIPSNNAKSDNSQGSQQTSGNNNNKTVKIELFDNYVELLTEILIRLPYQMKKLCLGTSSSSSSSSNSQQASSVVAAVASSNQSGDSPSTLTSTHHQQYQLALNQIATTAFDFIPWTHYLCEYLMLGPQCYFLKRLIKKLLQILCGSKDKYRKLKDQHMLNECTRQLIRLCPLRSAPSIPTSLGGGGGSSSPVPESSTSSSSSSSLTPPPDSFSPTSAVTLYQLSYPSLLRLIDQLKMMAEIASARTANWQRFLASHPRMLVYLFELALLMGVDSNGSGTDSSNLNGMTSCLATASTTTSSSLIPTILQLLILSLTTTSSSSSSNNTASTRGSTSTKPKSSQPGGVSTSGVAKSSADDERLAQHGGNLALTHIISAFPKVMSTNTLSKFIRTYLLEAAQVSIRWQTHAFLVSLFNKYLTVSNSSSKSFSDHALHLYESLMRIWPEATSLYGPKAAQYTDLVGYMAISLHQPAVMQEFLSKCISVYKRSLQLVSSHPNAQFYQTISPLIGASFDGYYLEPEPCFACNQLDQSVQNYKLNSIKADCRFTTSQQLFKLNNTYAVHKLMIKISDIRKSKMIARLNVYYTTRQVQSIVDLKMNPQLWLKAKRVNVQPAQTEIKIEFVLPLIASALIIEYVDFYDRDSLQIASNELTSTSSSNAMLQCPRCSALVAAHPGVCNTCGENVFQCHKCRAINYDERDPFLCNSCGFCKFAKFELTVVGRVHCTAEPIENDEDRKQTIQNISGLLERVDKVYSTIYQQIKPTIESILLRHNEQSALDKFSLLQHPVGGATTSASVQQNAEFNNLLVANNHHPSNPATGVIGFRLTPLTVISNSAQQQQPHPIGSAKLQQVSSSSSNNNNRLIQSLAQKYSVDCKAKFDELARLIIKLNLSRKELREYDKQFKTTTETVSNFLNRSNIQSRKNSTCGSSASGSVMNPSTAAVTSLAQVQSIKSSLSQSPPLFETPTTRRSYCYGCQLSASEHCINLFRALICSSINNPPLHSLIKTELCQQNILEDLIEFSLKQHRVNSLLLANTVVTGGSAVSQLQQQQQGPQQAQSNHQSQPATNQSAQPSTTTTAANNNTVPTTNNNVALLAQLAQQRLHDRDIVNLIYMLMMNNPEAASRFERILLDKLDLFLASSYHFYSSNPLQNELMLLGSLLMLPDYQQQPTIDSAARRRVVVACWEQQLRLVIHIMLRSLNAATVVVSQQKMDNSSGRTNRPSPIVIEYLTLPCLRMLTHLAKTTTNIPLIAQMVANLNLNKINSRVASFKHQQQQQPTQQGGQSSLNRFYFSEPADQSPQQQQPSPPPVTTTAAASSSSSSSGGSFTMPKLAELDLNVFLRSSATSLDESYYDKWVNSSSGMTTTSTKSSYLATTTPENDSQLAATKTKYFAAWRKYTLKKRKQKAYQQQHQQSKSIDSSGENQSQSMSQKSSRDTVTAIQSPPVVTNSETSATTSSIVDSTTTSTIEPVKSEAKPTSMSESNKEKPAHPRPLLTEYSYDLKMKWLRACIFCPSSKSVRQLSCQLIQSLFTFYSQLPQQQSTSLSSSSSTQPNAQQQSSGFSFALDNSTTPSFLSLSTTPSSLMSETSVQQYNARKLQIAELLCDLLDEACSFSHMGGGGGDICFDYLSLFKLIVSSDKDCKYRLVLRLNILNKLAALLIKEIKYIDELERLCESATFTLLPPPAFNLTLGYSVKMLVELLNLFLKEQNIKNKFKHRLVGTILNSYLSLKRLVYERSRLIDEAQEKLLACLEQLTSGTEHEQRRFMHICIQTVNNFDLDDLVTPVFIFERLCQIIYPEESGENKEFLLVLDKDPNQEDYLQGRMLGNPYNSSEQGLGPLMRNIKNKICTDCELVALLDDDNGMELLVNNKIISLDLPVKDVYKKVWLNEVLSEHEPMRIVYRMTGLSGDATEDIVDSLTDSRDTAKDDEDTYKMALELAVVNVNAADSQRDTTTNTSTEGALAIMLERMACINQQNFTLGKPLLSVLLKLFDYALKLSVNRQQLIKPEMKAITTMLHTLNTILLIGKSDPNKLGGVQLAEELIHIMEIVLSEASHQPADVYNEFAALCGDTEQLEFLLSMIKSTFVRTHSQLLQALMRLVPFLSFGDEKKMHSLIAYFKPYYTGYDEFDNTVEATSSTTTNNEYMLHLECFCVIVNGIEAGEMGKRLRDMMETSSVLQHSIDYLLRHSPPVTTYLNTDYDVWKDFITRRSLPYVLRLLTGLCRSHEAIQDLIGESCIPLLHKLEQFSSGNQVGILAEDLLVALKQNNNESSKVAAAIEHVRTQTKNEKKKLAMAKRSKELSQLGMKANEKGQLVATDLSQKLKTIQSAGVEYDMLGDEEKGHVCCICREGYKYHPQKVLAIYTFTKKSDLEGAYEARQRKTVGYSTVTHFNLVHIDCHTNAIRSARTCRDEWENAALQNANTKCNGMLPIWGPQVTETVFSNALARHNSYLLEATGIRDVSYVLSVHDLKLLMLRFAENLSFSEDSGGGGRESNINLIPYMIHSILYSINTAKFVAREERYMTQFLEATTDKIVSNSFECDNVFYYLSMALCIMKPSDWKLNRVKFLKRILLIAHTRLVNTPALDKQKLTSTVIQEFKKYKPSLLFLGLVDLFFKHTSSKVKATTSAADASTSETTTTTTSTESNNASSSSIDSSWTESFATYIRNNDVQLMESCGKVLKNFEEELIPCEDWLEMFDVMDFLHEVNDPIEFLQSYLQNFNK